MTRPGRRLSCLLPYFPDVSGVYYRCHHRFVCSVASAKIEQRLGLVGVAGHDLAHKDHMIPSLTGVSEAALRVGKRAVEDRGACFGAWTPAHTAEPIVLAGRELL